MMKIRLNDANQLDEEDEDEERDDEDFDTINMEIKMVQVKDHCSRIKETL
jgi:hypothetical protein